ncbi:MAG: multidrug resistance protein MdtH [Methanomassiliicoccales archaeon PtaB.Bin134]|nr:MAG: multidrug resistance protein MdtH [Methanomassiliicoccales archaeon PtaB.Bin134]
MRGTSDLFGFKGYDRRVWVLFYSRLIDGVGFSIVGPFLALFMYDTMDAPLALAGLVLTVAGVAGAVGSLVGGLAADRFGRWGVMTYSMLLRTSTFLALAFVISYWPNLWGIAGLLSVNYFFGGAFEPANNAMVADVVEPAKRLEAFGLLRVAWNLGFAFGPMVGGIIMSYSYFASFLASAMISLFAALIVAYYLKESYIPRPMERRPSVWREISSVRPLFLAFCIILIPMIVMSGQFGTTFTVYSSDRLLLSTTVIGLVFGLNGLMVVLFQIPIARWLGKRNMYLGMAGGTLLYCLGYLSLAAVTDGFGLALAMVVITLGELVVVPISMDLTVAMSGEEERGKYLGIYGLITSFGWFSASLVGGVLYDSLTDNWLLWSAVSALGLLTVLGMVPLWSRDRRSRAAMVQK